MVGSVNIDSYSDLRLGNLTTETLKITTGAQDGYLLQSDIDGNATWKSTIISDTYTNIQSLQSSNSLKQGFRYYITDRKIWVDALDSSTFSSSALRQQTIINNSAYSGSTLGVWTSTLTPSIGDKVIWAGKLWENVNGLVGSSLDIYSLDAEWNLLTSDPLYVEKVFYYAYTAVKLFNDKTNKN